MNRLVILAVLDIIYGAKLQPDAYTETAMVKKHKRKYIAQWTIQSLAVIVGYEMACPSRGRAAGHARPVYQGDRICRRNWTTRLRKVETR